MLRAPNFITPGMGSLKNGNGAHLCEQLIDMTLQESWKPRHHGNDCPLHHVPYRELIVALQGLQKTRANVTGSVLEEKMHHKERENQSTYACA
jgi:hypothetical protein